MKFYIITNEKIKHFKYFTIFNNCNLKIVKIFKLIEHFRWVQVCTKLYSSTV